MPTDPDTRSVSGDDGAGRSSLDSYLRSTDQLRVAGRWIVGTVGALAAVLLAGLRFADVGEIDPFSEAFFLASGGAVVAFGALGLVLVSASRLLTGRYISIREVLTHAEESRHQHRGRQRTSHAPAGIPIEWVNETLRSIEGERDLLYRATGAQTVRQVLRMQREILDDLAAVQLDAERRALRQRLTDVEDAAARIVAFADERFTRSQFRELGRRVAFAVPLVAVGIGTFSIAVGRQPDDPPLVEPTAVTVYFTALGADRIEDLMKCDGVRTARGFIVGGEARSPIVAIPPIPSCASGLAGRVTLNGALGVAVPDPPEKMP